MCPAEARVTLGVAAARDGDVETAVEDGERAPRYEHGPAMACPRSRLRRIGDEESPGAVGELACGKPYRRNRARHVIDEHRVPLCGVLRVSDRDAAACRGPRHFPRVHSRDVRLLALVADAHESPTMIDFRAVFHG